MGEHDLHRHVEISDSQGTLASADVTISQESDRMISVVPPKMILVALRICAHRTVRLCPTTSSGSDRRATRPPGWPADRPGGLPGLGGAGHHVFVCQIRRPQSPPLVRDKGSFFRTQLRRSSRELLGIPTDAISGG